MKKIRRAWCILAAGWRNTTAVDVSGPGIDDLVHAIAEKLADLSSPDAYGHELWDAYATARFNLAAAEEFGADEAGIDWLEDAVEVAWNALSIELPRTVRLKMTEARMVAGQLDEIAGRVGQVTT